MRPGKHQKNKKRRQDLYWKVHDSAQSFVLLSYTMHELQISITMEIGSRRCYLQERRPTRSSKLQTALHAQPARKTPGEPVLSCAGRAPSDTQSLQQQPMGIPER